MPNPRLTLNRWLKRIGAKKQWDRYTSQHDFTVECWTVGRHSLIVVDSGDRGWKLQVNGVQMTISEAAVLLGVSGCRERVPA
jgi:hypothetical protein